MAGPETAGDGLLSWSAMLLYMALIGTGFMLVEVPLIQRFQLLLGYPIVSLVVVLGTLLFAGGVGSLISQRWLAEHPARRIMGIGVWIAVLAVVYRLALPALVEGLLGQALALRILAVIVLTALLGLPMGIPFPSLMRVAGQIRQRTALLWAVNGAFSVLGSVLAVVISMNWGFSWALLLGAALYLALAALARPVLKG
jgi:predicted membrane-bound spermidine synthase